MDSNMSSIPKRSQLLRCSRKRILIVNCYLDDMRRPIPRTHKLPKPMGPVYLAGAFSPELCEVRLYCEMSGGPLEDPQLLAWPDMLVLTGLTTSFDRMLHLTAYARTQNNKVIIVAGGSAIRAFPRYARRFFDYCCLGDVEQMREVIADAFGKVYVSEEMVPRYDLAHWLGGIGFIESSKYCNFRCSFCTLTGEGRTYQQVNLEDLRRSIIAMGKKKLVLFIDNNFYGDDRGYFQKRIELIREMRSAGYLRGWAALVTNDFFFREENLKLVREAGCLALFSGVESFDTGWLRKMNKLQNTRFPQVELIRKCLDFGIVFLYGLMLDVSTRPIRDLRRELEFILSTPEITLPSYLSLPIPIPGTPFFYEALANGSILPRTKVRDLDGTTLSLQPLGPIEHVSQFIRDLQTMRGYRRRIFLHASGFARRYRQLLTTQQMLGALINATLLCAPSLSASPLRLGGFGRQPRHRTHISTTEGLDRLYQPLFRVASRYRYYFTPTMLTDNDGHLAESLADDLLQASRAHQTSKLTLLSS